MRLDNEQSSVSGMLTEVRIATSDPEDIWLKLSFVPTILFIS